MKPRDKTPALLRGVGSITANKVLEVDVYFETKMPFAHNNIKSIILRHPNYGCRFHLEIDIHIAPTPWFKSPFTRYRIYWHPICFHTVSSSVYTNMMLNTV